MEKFFGVSCQFALLVIALLTVEQVRAIDTVPQLNISQYVGRWYQVYGDYVVDQFVERNCECVTADYGRYSNGSVSVLNACRLKAPDGKLNTIKGYAYRPNENEQGKLKVVFGGSGSGGDYWVVQLGPPTFKGNYYQYSVISGPGKYDLFVLARNITEFKQNYDEEVLTKLKAQGFTRLYNKPTDTYQGKDFEQVRAIDTVPQLNISRYVGRWYQVYADYVVDHTFGRNCECATANYGNYHNGTVSVLNGCRLKTPDGKVDSITGHAYRPDEKEQGKLKVVFDGYSTARDYWVVQLGPATFNRSYYQYSVITGPLKEYLFVLARNVTKFKQNYDNEVLAELKEQGFTKFYNKPTEMYQGNDCKYL